MLIFFVLALSATLCAAKNNPNTVRPCRLSDIPCIRSSFSSGVRCGHTPGVPPSIYLVEESRFKAPSFNASYLDRNMLIKGLNRCRIVEYLLNRQTGGGVIAVNCPLLTIESNRVMYQHYPAQEDRIFRYYINGTYPLITFTTPLTRTNPIDLCREYSHAYVHALPIFNISPIDKPTANHLTRNLDALNVFEQETFAERANLLARVVINNLLCNFGCL